MKGNVDREESGEVDLDLEDVIEYWGEAETRPREATWDISRANVGYVVQDEME